MQYLNPGVFSSALGDAMLLGLSNILRFHIAVFTAIESWPYIPVHPRQLPVDICPILLTFLNVGPGHYSLAVRKTSTPITGDNGEEGSMQPTTLKCRCGRGRNAPDKQRLNYSKATEFSSKCLCLKSKSSCTPKCDCYNCDNQFGKKTWHLLPIKVTQVNNENAPGMQSKNWGEKVHENNGGTTHSWQMDSNRALCVYGNSSSLCTNEGCTTLETNVNVMMPSLRQLPQTTSSYH